MVKKGFTLAEVLITLGIIGLIAAMTLPAVINKTKRKQDSVKIKKFYSIMTQAVLLSAIDNGSPAEWTINSPIRDNSGTIIDRQTEAVLTFFNTYFAPYVKTLEQGTDEDGTYAYVAFADGSILYLSNGNCIDMIYDTNGTKDPNEYGRDWFDFLFCNKNYNEEYIKENLYFGAYRIGEAAENGREYTLNKCKSEGYLCSSLLLMDDWEFKSDYPLKY